MRRTKEEAKKTRQAVIEAALRLSGRYGYAEATLKAISRESGASRGPGYWHFRNKTERYEAVMEISQAPLARISHRSSTATAQCRALAGFCSVESFPIISTMPARFSVAKAGHDPPLSRLATNVGEICGLVERLVRDILADAAHAGTACGGRS